MRAFQVLLLMAIVGMSALFLVQNVHVLDTRTTFVLDLWWVKWSTPGIEFYKAVLFFLVLGLIFGTITFFPGNSALRHKIRKLKTSITNLTKELAAMQKKEEIQEEKQEEKVVAEPELREDIKPHPSQIHDEPVVSTGSASGRAALVGIFALFVFLVIIYYYFDQKISGLEAGLKQSTEKSMLASEKSMLASERSMQASERSMQFSELAGVLEQETKALKLEVTRLAGTTEEHGREISALRRLPQDTADYLTLMHIDEYSSTISRLMEKAENQEDREALSRVLDSLEKALEHYREKVN